MARVEAGKRPMDAIRIMERLVYRGVEVKLHWVGGGTLLGKMREYCEGREQYVVFLGALTEREKIKIMSEADAYISTSLVEGFNVTIGEALLSGLPVVAYDLPVYREVYNDFIVWVKPLDVDEFAEKLFSVLQDPQKYAPLVDEGRKWVSDKYSTQAVVSRMEQAFLAAMAKAQRKS